MDPVLTRGTCGPRGSVLATCAFLALIAVVHPAGSQVFAQGAIPEPDSIRYGSITLGGVPLAVGREVVVRNETRGNAVIARYKIAAGTTPANFYVARLPLASPIGTDPFPTDKARVGDQVRFWVDGSADDATVTIAARAEVVALNVDIPAGSACGNGSVSSGEQCDLGTQNGQPGSCCTASCTFVTAGTACADDGNPCTNNTCNAQGACAATPVPGTSTPCASDGNDCTRDVCSNGSCTHPNVTNGTACTNDGNPCTTDQCSSGTCGHPPVVDGTTCTADATSCTSDVCKSGACTHPAVPDGTTCSELSGCTGVQSCASGQCACSNCGNGIKEENEECDDGPADQSFCTAACKLNVCGDGVAGGPNEECDDGNKINGDLCREDCTLGPDYFACYKSSVLASTPAVPPNKLGQVYEDRLRDKTAPTDQAKVDLSKAASVCNPADFQGRTPLASTRATHLEVFAASASRNPPQPRFKQASETYTNVLGSVGVKLIKTDRVLVPGSQAAGQSPPSALSVVTADHYRCYKVAPDKGFKPVNVTFTDDFGTSRILSLTKAAHVCLPAAANGADAGTPAHPALLVCYQARFAPGQAAFVRQTVSTRNPHGADVLQAVAPEEFCVPSTKLP